MDITIREDALYVYADCFGVAPSTELYIELRSKAVPPNTSTRGAGVSLHKTATSTGECHFRVVKAALLLDVTGDEDGDLPREVTAIGPIASEVFTS